MLVRPPRPISRWLSELNVLFLHVAPPSVYKNLLPTPTVCGAGVSLWTGVWLPPTPSKIKQIFLSTNLASLLAFECWAARLHLGLQTDCQVLSSPLQGLSLVASDCPSSLGFSPFWLLWCSAFRSSNPFCSLLCLFLYWLLLPHHFDSLLVLYLDRNTSSKRDCRSFKTSLRFHLGS